MAVIFGTILVLAGCFCSISSVVRLTRANPATTLPLFRSAPSQPQASNLLNLAGIALIIWGANLMTPTIGAWAFALLIVTALGPFFVIRRWHNARVGAHGER